MKTLAGLIAVAVVLTAGASRAGPFAPAPQIIAEYNRDFIERSGAQTMEEMLDTGIIRYFFTGGRDLLVLVNGRPYATTGHNLDSLPLSAVERIEVWRGESLGTLGGRAAMSGAFNIVLRRDLDGFEMRSVMRAPSRKGGDGLQGSVFWGGAIGTRGHMTLGVDVVDRQEILGRHRAHSRSEWVENGSFSQAKNVSVGGNTVYVLQTDGEEILGFRSVALGDCDQAKNYTGPLSDPPGIRSGDQGCGFAYGNVWWDTASYAQKSAILNLGHALGEAAELHLDANMTLGDSAFRYAPSVDVFSFRPTPALIAAINEKTEWFPEADEDDQFIVGHRFVGHGNRDWLSKSEEFDISASVAGRLAKGLGYDARFSAYRLNRSVTGDTFVHAGRIREQISEGNYNLANPFSNDPTHLAAIANSSLREEEDVGWEYLGVRMALEGTSFAIGERQTAWTAGVELESVDAHRLLVFRDNAGETYEVNDVLGSGGTSFVGDRNAMAAFAEMSVPVADNLDLQVGGRGDEYSDTGGLQSWRFGAEYRPTGIVTLRGSWGAGETAPSMLHLYSTAAQDHPYVRCDPGSGPPPRACSAPHYRQVTREISGNPRLDSSKSRRTSIGAEARKGPFYFVADLYRLSSFDLPGQNSATWAILNLEECPDGGSNCIERTGSDITIHDSFANIVDTEVSGLNTRFGARKETEWGFVGMRGFWRRVLSTEQRIASEEERVPLPKHAVRVEFSVGSGDLTGFWSVNYRDEIPNQRGSGRFKSWTGHDLTLDWKVPFGLEGVRATAGVFNVTDTRLTTNTANPSASDGPRAAGWGRTFFLTLNMRF